MTTFFGAIDLKIVQLRSSQSLQGLAVSQSLRFTILTMYTPKFEGLVICLSFKLFSLECSSVKLFVQLTMPFKWPSPLSMTDCWLAGSGKWKHLYSNFLWFLVYKFKQTCTGTVCIVCVTFVFTWFVQFSGKQTEILLLSFYRIFWLTD